MIPSNTPTRYSNTVETLVPTVAAPATTANDRKPAISAYSMAVAPLSSSQSRAIILVTGVVSERHHTQWELTKLKTADLTGHENFPAIGRPNIAAREGFAQQSPMRVPSWRMTQTASGEACSTLLRMVNRSGVRTELVVL